MKRLTILFRSIESRRRRIKKLRKKSKRKIVVFLSLEANQYLKKKRCEYILRFVNAYQREYSIGDKTRHKYKHEYYTEKYLRVALRNNVV